MSETYIAATLLNIAKEGLRDIGYRDDLLREHYGFVDILAQDQPLRQIELAAFAQEPPSYRNACIGAIITPHDGPEAIKHYRALGAPQILAIYPEAEIIRRWKIPAHGDPIPIELIEPSQLHATIQARRDEWNPERVLRAKSIGFATAPRQLDFFDVGLLPTLEELVHSKLDSLLQEVIASSKSVYKEHHDKSLDYKALFRLIFRLIAAKLLGDRQYPGNWLDSNTQEVIRAVEAFYFQGAPAEAVLNDRDVQDVAWRKIRTAFSFQNLSVQALAYVYENTLVSPETRKGYGTHATASQLAEYIVNSLPFEALATDERHVFEPFCGHAPFLTAALGRLRALLPANMDTEQRHSYLIHMLSGMDVDSFACEVARNSLILADYPNPNGWHIENSNVFTSPELSHHLAKVQVILCNPPFEDFRRGERHVFSTNKAVEALLLALRGQPNLLGFILPRSFIDGQMYRKARQQIDNLYNNVALVALPDNAFHYSEAETVLLIAHGRHTVQSVRRSALVTKSDYERFIHTGEPTWQRETSTDQAQSATKSTIWYGRLEHIWDALAHLPRLGDVADIHNGIQYKAFKEKASKLVSDEPHAGFAPGLVRVTDEFEPYIPGPFKYLNMDPENMLYEAYKRPWEKPKVIANAARKSRGPWTIVAAIDEQGFVCYENFDGIWPRGDIPLEVIAALLNGPIANAFLSTHRTTRRNKIETIKRIPIPRLRPPLIRLIVSLVGGYCSYRKQWLEQPEQAKYFEGCCRGIMRQLDDELLTAYDLPLQLERELVKYFDETRRPGPTTLTKVDASSSKELYTSIIRVENIKNEDGNKIVEAVIMNWDSDELARFPLALVPTSIQEKVAQDIWLLAKVNVGAEKAQDLVFEDIELAPKQDTNNEVA